MISDDVMLMRRAIAAARANLGRTWPNPTVGCVIARDGLAAAVAAIGAEEPVILDGAEAVNKSYPGFFEQFRALGGRTEP